MPICHMAPAGPTSALAGALLAHLQCGLTVLRSCRSIKARRFKGINIEVLFVCLLASYQASICGGGMYNCWFSLCGITNSCSNYKIPAGMAINCQDATNRLETEEGLLSLSAFLKKKNCPENMTVLRCTMVFAFQELCGIIGV